MMSKIINCEDGVTVRGDSDTELLANARKHIADAHPDLVGQLSDEQLLGMAVEETGEAQR
jgi:hypothetical protein